MLPGNSEPLVVFTLDEQPFAVRLGVVERVVRAVAITPLPGAPRGVLGVVNVAGTIVPVFDFRRRFGLHERPLRVSDHFLLAASRGRIVAVLADAVRTVTLETAPTLESGDGLSGLHAGEGVVKLAGDIVFIHDLDRFLTAAEFAALPSELAPS